MFTRIQADTAGALAHRHFKSDGRDRPEFQREQRLELRAREQTPFFHHRSVKA